ncbi:Galactose/methyl galactoside import ATP-binding protein MglA [subsurface metagenome]|jgi:ABC-type sugar transport system ATPase subunit
MENNSNNLLLKFNKISKNFDGVRALNKVSFSIGKGEIHGLIGENGAGKSTLIKICVGIHKSDSGNILLDGEEVVFNNPVDSEKAGIRVVHQDVTRILCFNLSVEDNIFLGPNLERRGFFFLNRKKMNHQANELLKRLGIELDPKLKVGDVSPALQQLTLIARAFYLKAKIVIMDEPTTTLSSKEIDFLFRIVKKMKVEGTTFLFVSHKLNEIIEISDRITVLKDGKYVDTVKTKDVDIPALSYMMTGKSKLQEKLDAEIEFHQFQRKNVILEVNNLNSKKLKLKDISFKLYKSEILGIAGLLGSGRTELLTTLFGINSYDNGKIIFNNKLVNFKNPRQAIRSGIGLITEERNLALFNNLNLNDNIVPVIIDKLANWGWIKNKKYIELAKKYKELLEISAPSIKTSILSLSGGNQQKTLISRWLAANIKILLCDEPTKGIDVGSKVEIRRKMLDLSNHGVSIIYISSEFDELLKISDRILIISRGTIVKEFTSEEVKKLTLKNLNDVVYHYMAIDEKKEKIFIS